MRAIVDAIFFEAALRDLNGGTNSVTELMTGARRALDRANPWIGTSGDRSAAGPETGGGPEASGLVHLPE
jgi:hypothetical protein